MSTAMCDPIYQKCSCSDGVTKEDLSDRKPAAPHYQRLCPLGLDTDIWLPLIMSGRIEFSSDKMA
eukprot:4900351-Pyramimonas_sp.AAC.1